MIGRRDHDDSLMIAAGGGGRLWRRVAVVAAATMGPLWTAENGSRSLRTL